MLNLTVSQLQYIAEKRIIDGYQNIFKKGLLLREPVKPGKFVLYQDLKNLYSLPDLKNLYPY